MRRVRAGFSPKTKKAAQRRPSMQPGAKTQPFSRLAIAVPRSPGDFTVVTPAFSSAANLPSAVPAPPEDIADRKSVVSGKRVSVRVDLGGLRIIKKKIQQ